MPPDVCRIVETRETAVIATAIHAGHAMRPSLQDRSALTSAQRLREEDPFTDLFARGTGLSIAAVPSRFQVDLNRPRERAVYRRPEDAWGLKVWTAPLSDEDIEDSLREYDTYYGMLKKTIDRKLNTHKRVYVLDLHSYNHRRQGERAPFDDPQANPEINIGTGTLPDRERWKEALSAVWNELNHAVIMGRYLDVRENIKFRGGEMARWIHTHYPENVCCISLEFKKIFMNEWDGSGNLAAIDEIKSMVGRLANYLETI